MASIWPSVPLIARQELSAPHFFKRKVGGRELAGRRGATVYNAPMPRAAAYLPALLLLLFSGWCGTFDGAARGAWTVAGHLALLAVVVAAGPAWRDPLRLGRAGNLLLLLFALATALAFYQSPVPRAGRVALVLLPAFVLIPAFVEQCWSDPDRRRHGLLALTATVGLIAAWSLAGWWWLDTPGASLPLGHHNLLAAWLVTLLPLALLPLTGVGRVVGLGL